MSDPTKLDAYLNEDGAAALVLRDELAPVEGPDGVFFPPTYAEGEKGAGFRGGYNIDEFNGENVCLVDSVGSQANRIEPMFKREPYSGLVPQIAVRAGEHVMTIFEAGHRAGDALFRCSELQAELQQAFRNFQRGDATALARVAPTSLVFGVWDSRDTQAKAPRVIASTIRAFNVQQLTRSAQFVPAAEYVADGLLEEPLDEATKKAYAERGFIHVPATGKAGGIRAQGGVRRDATLSLAALRLLRTAGDAEATLRLQRYVLGLALTAFTANVSGYLRQGCNLVLDISKTKPRSIDEVHPSGERKSFTLTHADTIAYAQSAAAAFGVGPSKTVEFDKVRAQADAKPAEKKSKSKPKPAGAKEPKAQ
jgi:CRISPR-associated protein Csb1